MLPERTQRETEQRWSRKEFQPRKRQHHKAWGVNLRYTFPKKPTLPVPLSRAPKAGDIIASLVLIPQMDINRGANAARLYDFAPFGGSDNTDAALNLGLTPPGYTIPPHSIRTYV
jgi:hypothetical protein